METEQQVKKESAKRSPRIVKPTKQEDEYQTKVYIKRAVKNYEERMRTLHPEKYEKVLEYQRQYYQMKKLKQQQLKLSNIEITNI